MPQEAGQPGTPEHEANAAHESEVKRLKQRIAQLEDEIANYKQSGTPGPTQASSAALENYPETPPQTQRPPEETKGKQPLSGPAATAKQKPK